MRKPTILHIEGREPLKLKSREEGVKAFQSALHRKANKHRGIVLKFGDRPILQSYAKFHQIAA